MGRGLKVDPSRALRDIRDALGFFTRLPVRGSKDFRFAHIAWAAAVAGAIVGLVGAIAFTIGIALSLPVLFSAGLATAAMIASTGALHEDGLADVADGFGGGGTRERKLEIMRDSRIGSFGATALALALILRVAALGAVAAPGLSYGCAALVAIGALSRAGALAPLAFLESARADGAGAAAGRLPVSAFTAGCVTGVAIAFVVGAPSFGPHGAVRAVLGAAAGAAGMTALARRQIGGQTGDVAGAAQQCSEIGAWLGLLIGGPPA